MATKTLLRTISGIDDVRAALNNSTMRRLLSIGTDWTKVRVGIRFSVADTGADLGSTPFLAMGLCSGTANPVNNGSASTDHFVGMRTVDATWGRSAATPPYWICSTYAVLVSKRIGTTWTNTGGTNNFWYAWYVSAGTSYRQFFFLDITKGSPNFTLRATGRSGVHQNPTFDCSKEYFLERMTQPTPSYENDHSQGGDNTLAVSEATNGYLNAVNIAWDRTNPKWEISDVAVARFA
ncbi:MAG: hypothetical protein KJ072_15715 [Verrucomicrobia bacterium]|nr:hypothetical protein [Verrucomicrobiota bacterium]